MTQPPDLPVTWRAPSARTGIGIAVMVLGGAGAVTFGALGLLIGQVPRMADVPVHGVLGSVALFLVGVGLFASVPRLSIDLQRRELRSGARVVADLGRCRAVLLRQVEQRMIGEAGGAMTAEWWGVAAVLDGDGVDGADVDGAGPAGTADPLRAAEVVELVRGVPRRRAEAFACALAAAFGRPVVTVDAVGRVSV